MKREGEGGGLLEMFGMIVLGPRLGRRPYMDTAFRGGLNWHLFPSPTDGFSFQACLMF